MREAFVYLRNRDWDKLQSLWVLPAARRLYLIGALGAILVTALALAAALLFQIISLGPSPRAAVPEPPEVEVKPINPASLDALFKGPQLLTIEAIPVVRPVTPGTAVGRFYADTPWGIADTDGFQLVGGRNLAMFREAPDIEHPGSVVLTATDALAKRLAAMPTDAIQSQIAEVRVIAKDGNGNISQPATLNFRIVFKPPESPATTDNSAIGFDNGATIQEAVEDVSAPQELERIVTALARLAGESGTVKYFEAKKYAIDEPARCGARDNPGFNAAYISAYDRVHASLTQSNVDTFYRGLCAAWDKQLSAARQERTRLEIIRAEAMARNAAAEAATEARKTWARALRAVAISFAIAATGFFMVVALFLAFLAIEGHSNALRQAIEILARERSRDDA